MENIRRKNIKRRTNRRRTNRRKNSNRSKSRIIKRGGARGQTTESITGNYQFLTMMHESKWTMTMNQLVSSMQPDKSIEDETRRTLGQQYTEATAELSFFRRGNDHILQDRAVQQEHHGQWRVAVVDLEGGLPCADKGGTACDNLVNDEFCNEQRTTIPSEQLCRRSCGACGPLLGKGSLKGNLGQKRNFEIDQFEILLPQISIQARLTRRGPLGIYSNPQPGPSRTWYPRINNWRQQIQEVNNLITRPNILGHSDDYEFIRDFIIVWFKTKTGDEFICELNGDATEMSNGLHTMNRTDIGVFNATRTPVATSDALNIMVVIIEIKQQLAYQLSMKPVEVVAAAAADLGMDVGEGTLKEKVKAIAFELGITTGW